MNERNRNRILWVDVAKGLGVYLVVLGHLWYLCYPAIICQAIYAFHMALFFILSGFVFNASRKSKNFSEFALTKVKRVLVPAMLYIAMFVLIYVPVEWKELDIGKTIEEILFLYGKCYRNDPCWFFFTLFQIYLVMYLINIKQFKLVIKTAIMFLIALIGYFVYTNQLIHLFGIDRAIISSSFFIAGIIARELYEQRNVTKAGNVLIFVFSLCMFVLFGLCINGKTSFYNRDLDHYYAFLLSGIFGTVVLCYFCALISHYRIAKYLTISCNNAVFIVGTHFIVVKLFFKYARALNIENTWCISIVAITLTILLVEIYRHVCRFLDNNFPILTGK